MGLFLDRDDHSRHLHPTLPLQAPARRVATGPFPDNDDHHGRCHVTQHHHPVCEPLLVGGYGGADDNGTQDNELMNGRDDRDNTTGMDDTWTTNDGDDERGDDEW
jgi:hypothetical protein